MNITLNSQLIENAIHKVPHFPKQGILFYDITGILYDSKVFGHVIDYYCDRYMHDKPDVIAAVDSRGFIFASPVAYKLQVPLMLIRKSGKLPRKTVSQSFNLEYGSDTIELHPDDVPKGGKVVLFDDLLATGGTANASCMLLEKQGAYIQEIASVIALDFLPYKEVLSKYKLHYLVSYSSETVDSKV